MNKTHYYIRHIMNLVIIFERSQMCRIIEKAITFTFLHYFIFYM